MTEQTGQQPGQTPRPSWMDTPPAWYNSPPPQHSPPPQQQYSGGNANADILQALSAMPEKIVNAIREATGQNKPQQQQPPPQQQPPAQQTAPQGQDTPPRQKTFAERWFETG